MVLGSTFVGVHMAMTQGVLFGMLASYIPSHPLPGLGRISGTAWSLTDLALGEWVVGWQPACHPATLPACQAH